MSNLFINSRKCLFINCIKSLSIIYCIKPSARASKVILYINQLALHNKSNLVRKLGLNAGQARTARDDRVSCIQNPTISQILAKLFKHLPNPEEKLDQSPYKAVSREQIGFCR